MKIPSPKSVEDAPRHYSADEADAWVAGWNACRDAAVSMNQNDTEGQEP